jgi:menaquinone-specific isochorismate synthase
VTTVGDVDPTEALLGAGSNGRTPHEVTVRSSQPVDDWCAAVVAGRQAVRDGRLRKVVLARELEVQADLTIPRDRVLQRLADTFPGCILGAVGGFVCASPEVLVARDGDVVRSHPLAGTAPRGGDPSADARLAAGLLASAKDRDEHRITIDYVHEVLLPWCSFLDEEAEPSLVGVANVQHLGTMVEGRLSDPAPTVLELVEALHPTPAVAGDPPDEALALIAELEPGDRGRYAGPVGWVDAAGNGTWAVGIRSAELRGPEARLWAGVGIVTDSDPDAELEETRAKLQAMLGALTRL